MKNFKRAILVAFAVMMFAGVFALDASAQTRRVVVKRPVVVRPVVVARPYWYYNPYYYGYGYGSYYDPYWSSPYLRYQEQKFYLERELRGNERELAEHREKYSRDGFISAKEQRELDDDVKDVRNSRAKLQRFLRNN